MQSERRCSKSVLVETVKVVCGCLVSIGLNYTERRCGETIIVTAARMCDNTAQGLD